MPRVWIHVAMHSKLPLIEHAPSTIIVHSAILIGPHLPARRMSGAK